LQAALRETRTRLFGSAGDRPNVPNIGLLVSDGHSTVNASRTLPEAQFAKRDGITLLAVVVNADHNLADMRAIASDPSRDLFMLINPSDLDSVVERALDRLCGG